MVKRVRAAKRLLVDLPKNLRLAYCLMRDPRVPVYTKLAFGGALGVIAVPTIEIPHELPFVGELDVVALTALAARLFISACPRYVVEEQERLIIERRSRFDEDVRRGERLAMMVLSRIRGHEDVVLPGSAVPVSTRAARESA